MRGVRSETALSCVLGQCVIYLGSPTRTLMYLFKDRLSQEL